MVAFSPQASAGCRLMQSAKLSPAIYSRVKQRCGAGVKCYSYVTETGRPATGRPSRLTVNGDEEGKPAVRVVRSRRLTVPWSLWPLRRLYASPLRQRQCSSLYTLPAAGDCTITVNNYFYLHLATGLPRSSRFPNALARVQQVALWQRCKGQLPTWNFWLLEKN